MKRTEFVAFILEIVRPCNDYDEAKLALEQHGFVYLDCGVYKTAMHRPEDRYVVKLKRHRSYGTNKLRPYDPLDGYGREARIQYVPMAYCCAMLQIQARVIPCKNEDRFGLGKGKTEDGFGCWMMGGTGDGHTGNHTHLKSGAVRMFDYDD